MEQRLLWDDLPRIFPTFEDSGRWLPKLQRHAELLEAASERVRVSSVPAEAVVRRQYAESLELLRMVLEFTARARVVDVGSGGGFPGMIFAVLLPSVEVHLIEPLQKRARLLREVADELGLGNVVVHPVRAEEAGRVELRDSADLVTARAVAELRELLEYTTPLAREGGMLALPKGSGAEQEVEEAGEAAAKLHCAYTGTERMRPVVSEMLSVVFYKKAGPTPEKYPRRAGLPGKRPL